MSLTSGRNVIKIRAAGKMRMALVQALRRDLSGPETKTAPGSHASNIMRPMYFNEPAGALC